MGSVVFSSSYSTPIVGSATYNVRVSFSETYNQATNKTTLRITGVELQKVGNSTNWGSLPFFGSVRVNGTTLLSMDGGSSVRVSLNGGGYCSVAIPSSGSVEIEHNADGSKSVSFAIVGGFTYGGSTYFCALYPGRDGVTNYPFGAVSSTKTVALTTHPRISSVSATDAYFGEAVTITLSRYNADFTHTVRATCAGVTETLMTKGSTYPTLSWTPSVAVFAPLITNAMSTTATITSETYNGDVLIGTATTTCTLTFKAADVAPGVSISTSDPTGNLAIYGKYVKSKSKIQVSLTNTFRYGATLASVSINANGATYNESPAVTDFILSADYTQVSARIVDSRGQEAVATLYVDIYDYTPPQINSCAVHRCTASGAEDNTGAYFSAVFDVAITPLGDHNSKTMTVKYKKQSATAYSSANVPLSGYSVVGASQPIAADTDSTYNVQVELRDDFGTAIVVLKLPTAATRVNYGAGANGGIAIGKVSEMQKTVELAEDWKLVIGTDRIAPVLTITTPVISSLPVTFYSDEITADHAIPLNGAQASNPDAIVGAITWTTANGSITFSGTINGTTTITFELRIKKQVSVET